MTESTSHTDTQLSDACYREVVRGLYEAVIITDLNGTVIDTNPRAAALFGQDATALRKKNICDVLSGLDHPTLQGLVEALAGQKHVLIEASGVRNDTSLFPAELAAHRAKDEAGNDWLCFSVRDVTHSNRVEDKLEEAQERLLTMERIKTRMDTITTLAHEINNPLQSLMGMIEGDKNIRYARPLNRIVAVMQEMCQNEELKSVKYAGSSNRLALLPPDTLRCTARHLLIVEDELTLRNYFSSLLREKIPDLVIDCVENGAEALESFKVKHQAVIIMDIFMPVMNGEEAFRLIRKTCSEKQWEMPSVVFCTGYIPPDSVREAIANDSLHCYLAKPVAGETIVNAIRNRFEFHALSSGSNG